MLSVSSSKHQQKIIRHLRHLQHKCSNVVNLLILTTVALLVKHVAAIKLQLISQVRCSKIPTTGCEANS